MSDLLNSGNGGLLGTVGTVDVAITIDKKSIDDLGSKVITVALILMAVGAGIGLLGLIFKKMLV